MATLSEIERYTDQLLESHLFQDYCPNGVQVAGKKEVHCLVSGVSANQSLFEEAIEEGADAVLVHHGFFWKGEKPCLVGTKYDRLAMLIKNDISLLAYHLPLDAHPELGNNAQLARRLGLTVKGDFAAVNNKSVGLWGQLSAKTSGEVLFSALSSLLNREPLHIGDPERPIKKIALCTGAAQDYIEEAADLGVDAFITGEASERTVPLAWELGIHFYAAGHHATERYGVDALGNHLAEKFDLEHIFVDVENPV